MTSQIISDADLSTLAEKCLPEFNRILKQQADRYRSAITAKKHLPATRCMDGREAF